MALMADWNLDVTIVSASNLVDVRNFGIMRVYAEVSINEVQKLTFKSPVDCEGETNPVWNFNIAYNITNTLIEGDEFKLVIKLYCERTFKEDKYVGEVNLSLKALFQSRNTNGGSGEFEVERVNEDGGFGALKLSYCFSEIVRPTTDTSVPSSVVRLEEKSFSVSGVLKGAASSLLSEIVMGVAEIFIPGSSVIVGLMQGE